MFADLAAGLDQRRWEGHAVIPSSGWVGETLKARGIEPIVIPAKGSYSISYLRRIMELVRDLRIELIHSHLFGPALYGSLAGRLCGVPVISTLHGEPDLPGPGQQPTLRYRVLRSGVDSVVLVSRALQDAFHACGSFPRERSTVIHNGIDLDVFRPAEDRWGGDGKGASDDGIIVGAVGNLRPAKGFDLFVQAAGSLASRDARLRFVIAGTPDQMVCRQLQSLRDELGLRDRLSFLGFRADIAEVFRSLDVFVCSSRSEGFSLTTVQALACGVPAVATRCGGPEEIITDGVDGLLVDSEDPEKIASAVQRLIEEPQLRRSLKTAGRHRAAEAFSVDAMIAAYEALYDEVLN